MQQLPAPSSAETWQIISAAANNVGAIWVAVAAWSSTKVTRRVFESAYRPYIGVEMVNSSINLNAGTLITTPVIKNHGSAPSQILSLEWLFRLNGDTLPQSHTVKILPTTFPQQSLRATAKLADTSAIKATQEGRKLGIVLLIRYKGGGERIYSHEQEATLQQGSATMHLGSTKETEE